ncbi:DnaJ-domain-containing protein [Lojkania enalia]|uniref:DnaJ-domain-containing protein n=1 Tax=Lojkania enalia TaxID=147567 RepID=A0A9P4JVQ5_9PLEO|nr:DnaJ-domain-containing protein [Didymosphaeria enalia]
MPRRQKEELEIDEDEEMDGHDLEDEDPPSINPYDVLGLKTDASTEDVKKIYRKLALKHHPDKAQEADKTAANQRFQEIAFAYAVLSDEARRKRYDLTGSTSETVADDDEFDWLKFYKAQYEELVNEENIKRIATEYKGSEEEKRNLLDAYNDYKGNLDRIYSVIMLSDVLEDDERFIQFFNDEISKGNIETYPAYEKQKTPTVREKVKKAEIKRREEFDKNHGKKDEDARVGAEAGAKGKPKAKSKKSDLDSMADLATMIQQKQATRASNFFDHLEAKYAPKQRGQKRAMPMDEPPEEMFQATAKKGEEHKKKRRTTKKKQESDDGVDHAEEDIVESEEDEKAESLPKSKRGKLVKGRGRAKAQA